MRNTYKLEIKFHTTYNLQVQTEKIAVAKTEPVTDAAKPCITNKIDINSSAIGVIRSGVEGCF
ncbi:hypothetical protein [Rubrolithibacter danxiaensis]|uniref:hypothetical protein n=1 Tax=Rubrolithibacter danxiaensis TaxID=3390805 RepID=UPI003BF814B0